MKLTPTKKSENFDLLDQTGDREYDQQFFKAHRTISFKSSLYFAIASASFFGVLSNITGMLVRAVEEDQPVFKSKKTPLLIAGLMSMGSVFAFWSNTQQTKLQQLEDNRLARRINGGHGTPEEIVTDEPKSQWQDRVKQTVSSELSR